MRNFMRHIEKELKSGELKWGAFRDMSVLDSIQLCAFCPPGIVRGCFLVHG